MKIAYLTNIPSPYRIAMIEAWVRELSRNGIELSTYYTDEGDQGRGWNVRPTAGAREVRLRTLFSFPGYGRFNLGLFRMVRESDVVMIGGFEQASYLASALLARLMRRKVVLLFDGFSPKRMKSDPPHARIIKKLTAWLCHGFFANGQVGRDFLVGQLGVDHRKVFNQYLSVPTGDIEAEMAVARSRKELRLELGVPQDRLVLASCGYLIERKRPDLIIDALALIHPARRPTAMFIGRGPLEGTLASQAKKRGVDIRFAGFRQGRELAKHYLASDALVLASRDDPWGLVVNEAMAAGLPVVCSDACGANLDLVEEGVTGFDFSSGSADDLAFAIEKLIASDLPSMGRAARVRVASWTPEHSAKSLMACIESLGRQRAAELQPAQ